MPTLTCACGTAINLSAIPSPYGWLLVPEAALDTDEPMALRDVPAKQTYLCPVCGRLHLFDPAGAAEPATVWAVERGEPPAAPA